VFSARITRHVDGSGHRLQLGRVPSQLPTTIRLVEVNEEIIMTEQMKSAFVSRRGVFGLFGLAVASAVALPVAMLTVTDAEARIGNPGSAASLAGMNRRDRRRDRRYKKNQ
jgi:hypothetical protein